MTQEQAPANATRVGDEIDVSLDEHKGILVTDVDKTLYRTTDAIKAAMKAGVYKLLLEWGIIESTDENVKKAEGGLKISSNLIKAFGYWLAKKYKGREWFSQKVDGLYMPILLENGPQLMKEFYGFVARNQGLHHDGAIEVLRAADRENLMLALVSGNDRSFLHLLLEENGFDPGKAEIHGATFEERDGRYTGDSNGTNTAAERKSEIIAGLQEKYPDLPIVGALGDDLADKPAFDEATKNRGVCVVVGDDENLMRALDRDGYRIFAGTHAIDKYLAADRDKRVIRVTPYPEKEGITLHAVARRLPDLLSQLIVRST